MGILKIKNLIHDFKDSTDDVVVRAVDGVNMEVKEGQFIVILGHNGSGKSSLAKHINAILRPTDGTVWVDGIDTKEHKRELDIRKTAGMVFQNPDDQIVATVVEEDVAFGPENLCIPTDDIWRRVERALGNVQMTAFRKKSPLKLSGGQKQRVAIAGIIAMEPKCIVLDEPTAMLDPMGRGEVLDTLYELNKKKNITIILITHHMNEAINADKVFVMNDGKVEISGTPREVFSQVDKIKECGLELPPVTELGHKLKESGLDIADGLLTVEELMVEINNNRIK